MKHKRVTVASFAVGLAAILAGALPARALCTSDDECDDQDLCTTNACILNICIFTTIPDCRACSGPGECDDGDPCTIDLCNGEGLCENPSEPDGTPCRNDLFCDGDESCQYGECVDGPESCIDLEHCDEDRDVCLACVNDDECDDDDSCTHDACVENECVHTPRPGCEAVVHLDIKPGSCPNPVNPRSKGVVSIAIVGSSSFDVTQIDVDSLTLVRADGVGGIVTPTTRNRRARVSTEDVATPLDDDPCACHELGGDGIDDLLLKFSTPALAIALELASLQPGASLVLTVGGSLMDGSEFEASDCIVIVGRNAMQK